ncbi:MAG: type II secretion system protein GspE, partial [Bdellovibrionota bacterium]
MSLKVGEILVQQGIIRSDQLQKALDEQKKSGLKLTSIFIQLGFVKENQILRALEKSYQVPGVDLNGFEIDKSLTALVPRELCEKHLLIPLQKAGQTLVVAFSDPSNIVIKEDVRFLTRMKIQPVVSTTLTSAAASSSF